MYFLLHFEDKEFYARIVEIGLTLDCKDFVPNGYHVDEEKYPRTTAKMVRRKGKALVSLLQQEIEVVEKEEKDAAKEENYIDLNDDDIGALGGSEDRSQSSLHLFFGLHIFECVVRLHRHHSLEFHV